MSGPATPPGAHGFVPANPSGDPRRRLTLLDRLLWAPVGFLWLVFLAFLAVPVMVYMTVLYYAARVAGALLRRGRGERRGAERDAEEQRVA